MPHSGGLVANASARGVDEMLDAALDRLAQEDAEAAQLVIQAGSMAEGGDVFVLDMGKPVRIEDLARRMINLMGLTVRDEKNPEGDIEISYTGLRPAEP